MQKLRCAQWSLSYQTVWSKFWHDVKKSFPTERTSITLKRTPQSWERLRISIIKNHDSIYNFMKPHLFSVGVATTKSSTAFQAKSESTNWRSWLENQSEVTTKPRTIVEKKSYMTCHSGERAVFQWWWQHSGRLLMPIISLMLSQGRTTSFDSINSEWPLPERMRRRLRVTLCKIFCCNSQF